MPRSNKPTSLKAEVWTRHALRQTNSQIARDLGISRNTVAKIIAERQVEQVGTTDAVRALARAGITLDTIAQKLREGMEATETKLATWDGRFTDRVEVPDHSAWFRNVEAAGKMLEMFPKEETNQQAALLIRLPDVELTPNHGKSCTRRECAGNWSKMALSTPASVPRLPDE
jgi:hypothetical protein